MWARSAESYAGALACNGSMGFVLDSGLSGSSGTGESRVWINTPSPMDAVALLGLACWVALAATCRYVGRCSLWWDVLVIHLRDCFHTLLISYLY